MIRHFVLITAAGMLATMALPTAAQTVPLATTISPEARALLMSKMAHDAPQPQAAPQTQAEWDKLAGMVDTFGTRDSQAIVARLQPRVTELTLGGTPALKVEPTKGAGRTPVLIYVHGGGFIVLSPRATLGLAATMAARTGSAVYSLGYTLAPKGHWNTATDQVVAAYKALLATGLKPDQIGIFGDSAGGNLVAASVLKLRDQGLGMPAALVLMSPATNLTGAGDSRLTLSDADPILKPGMRELGIDVYAAPADRRNPYASPVYGDYTRGFPPTLIQVGTREWLLSDAVREYQAIDAGGNEAVLDVYEGMTHVFQSSLAGSPEADRAFTKAAAFLTRHLKR